MVLNGIFKIELALCDVDRLPYPRVSQLVMLNLFTQHIKQIWRLPLFLQRSRHTSWSFHWILTAAFAATFHPSSAISETLIPNQRIHISTGAFLFLSSLLFRHKNLVSQCFRYFPLLRFRYKFFIFGTFYLLPWLKFCFRIYNIFVKVFFSDLDGAIASHHGRLGEISGFVENHFRI